MTASLTAKLLLGLAVLAALAGVYLHIFNQGEAAEVAKVQTRTRAVQGKVDAAEAATSRAPADVSRSLRDGSF